MLSRPNNHVSQSSVQLTHLSLLLQNHKPISHGWQGWKCPTMVDTSQSRLRSNFTRRPYLSRNLTQLPMTLQLIRCPTTAPTPHQCLLHLLRKQLKVWKGSGKKRHMYVFLFYCVYIDSWTPSFLQSKLIQWLTLRDSTLDELLRLDGLGSFIQQDLCMDCSKHPGCYRCPDCGHGAALLCQTCLIKRHRGVELHRVEVCTFRYIVYVCIEVIYFLPSEVEW